MPEPHIEVHTFQATIPSGAMLDPLTREPQYTPDGELLTWEGYFAAAALAYFIARSQMPKELRELLDAAEARIQRAFLFGTGGILRP